MKNCLPDIYTTENTMTINPDFSKHQPLKSGGGMLFTDDLKEVLFPACVKNAG